MAVQCNLADLRHRRGLSAADLARRVDVQRQTIYAIESGSYVPNTAVALRLARELEVRVEDLFHLPEDPVAPKSLRATVVAGTSPAPGSPVRLVRVADDWLAFPREPVSSFLPDADGVLSGRAQSARQADVLVADNTGGMPPCLVIAGCDPALSLLAVGARQLAGTPVLPVSACSKEALRWLRKRWVHVAGCHLEDPVSGEFNLPALRKLLPGEDLAVVTFAEWEEGFVVSAGNPLGVREAGDLANPRLRYINREPGSGSRALLDFLLRKAALPARDVAGYEDVAGGHLAAVRAVHEGRANCCIATSSASRAFQLGFVPLRRERFDLVIRKESLELPSMRALLDCLQRQSLRRRLETLAGYDTTHTGQTLLA